MSVINQMLRDLDKQRQQQHQSIRSQKASKPQRLRLWVLLCGAMVLAVMAYWLGMHHAPVLATTAIQPTVAPAIAKPSVAEASTAKPVESPLTETTSVKPESAEPELANSQTKKTLKQSESISAVPQDDTATSLAQNSASSSASSSASTSASNAGPQPTSKAATQPILKPTQASLQQITTDDSLESEPMATLSNEVVATAMINEDISEPTEQATSASQMSVSQSSTLEQAEHLYQQYLRARAQGQFAFAETSLRQLQAIEPQRALPLLAELYWQQQLVTQVDAVLVAAHHANLSDRQLVRIQLLRLQQQQRWPELIVQLTDERIAELGVEFLAMKAQALWQTAQYTQALPIYQQWTTQVPNDARAWLGQALVLEQLQQPSAAKKAYQQALTLGGLSAASLQFIQQRLAALKEY